MHFPKSVVWITGQQVQAAEIHIEPPQLGPIEVRVSITNDQANLLFNAPHAVARDAIQMSLPRLQEMLIESGLTLGNVSVGAHNAGGQQAFATVADRGADRSSPDTIASVEPSVRRRRCDYSVGPGWSICSRGYARRGSLKILDVDLPLFFRDLRSRPTKFAGCAHIPAASGRYLAVTCSSTQPVSANSRKSNGQTQRYHPLRRRAPPSRRKARSC